MPASEIEGRKEQMTEFLEKAEKEKVDFICFPEGFLTGYFSEEKLARKSALDIKEEAFLDWVKLTKGFSATVIAGFNERSENEIFDSAVAIENGQLIGIQRKHHLYHDYFSPGADFLSFHTKGVTFGILICLDTNYFEPARLLAMQGVSLLFSPLCNRVPLTHPFAKRPAYYSHFVARSFENRCWLITADWVWPNDGISFCPGHTVIYNPDGEELARSHEAKNQFLSFEIPRSSLTREKGRRVLGSPLLSKKLAKLITRH
jgi:omega-amidase